MANVAAPNAHAPATIEAVLMKEASWSDGSRRSPCCARRPNRRCYTHPPSQREIAGVSTTRIGSGRAAVLVLGGGGGDRLGGGLRRALVPERRDQPPQKAQR